MRGTAILRVVLPAIIAAGAVWSLIPIPVWLVGTAPDEYLGTWAVWGWGSLVVGGVTAVALVLSRGRAADALVRVWRRSVALPRSWVFVAIAAAAFALLSVAFTLVLFNGNPRNVDGFAQLFQARIFLAGRLWVPPPPEVAHFATLHMILGPDRWFAQYPPGQSLVLAGGLALGAWWILLPAIGMALVAATMRLARWIADETTARLSAILLCLSPFALAVAGSEMNHLAAATLGAAAAALGTFTGHRRWPIAAVGAGVALGIMTAFRPLDAVAAAVPVAAVTLLAARRRAAALILVGLGSAIATLPTLWFNAQTTGHWLEFGYTLLWGPEHSLGFHEVPFGVALTPSRALGLTALDLHQLNRYLFDVPVPILAVVALGYVVSRRSLGSRDVVPVVGVGALVGLLFFYWHRDVFYGPRFLYTALPWLAVLTARGLTGIRRAAEGHKAATVAVPAIVAAFAFGLVALAPSRLEAYRASTPTLNFRPHTEAARQGIRNAVVLIPDGWGSRLIARMWALGVPVRRSTRLYAAIDACTLHRALDAAAGDPERRVRLVQTLDSLASLGRPGTPARLTEDRNLRIPTWEPLTPVCTAEIAFDRRGVLAFAPYLYHNTPVLDGEIVWARDMRDLNGALARRYPGRSFYRYAPVSPGGQPQLIPLPR